MNKYKVEIRTLQATAMFTVEAIDRDSAIGMAIDIFRRSGMQLPLNPKAWCKAVKL